MLLLSIISTFIFSTAAKPSPQSVEVFFKNYVNNVTIDKVSHQFFTKDFINIMEDDKIIFAPCSKNKCLIKAKVTTPKHNTNIRRIETQVTYKKGRKTLKITSRRGCYFAIKDQGRYKLDTYLEDCHEH